ncbi:MAG TPA: hypothetical protein VFC26_07065, partial [Verrucomicrobiae bacterium]|nr:hypothetical protein [Verrucomicrobiae bacterium]
AQSELQARNPQGIYAHPGESAARASCFVSAQRVYIPTPVPSGKLKRYKQPRTITNTRAHERRRNKPAPPIMAKIEIKTSKTATAMAADVVIKIVSLFSDNSPSPVTPTDNNNAAKMPSAPSAI